MAKKVEKTISQKISVDKVMKPKNAEPKVEKPKVAKKSVTEVASTVEPVAEVARIPQVRYFEYENGVATLNLDGTITYIQKIGDVQVTEDVDVDVTTLQELTKQTAFARVF